MEIMYHSMQYHCHSNHCKYQIDETGASSAETTKTPLNTSVPESTVVVAEYIQIGCGS